MSEPANDGPNLRRVAAGRANRQKARPMSESSRQRLREAAIRQQPWRFATGPRTDEGKQKCAQNAKKKTSPTSDIVERIASYSKALRKLSNTRYVDVATGDLQTTELLRDLLMETLAQANKRSTDSLTNSLRKRGT